MGNVGDIAIVVDMDVQSVLLEVLRYHLAGLDHSVFLGEIALREVLQETDWLANGPSRGPAPELLTAAKYQGEKVTTG